ncbi:MAG: hypothetical protein IH593_01485, partial [Bacteroidales bacterium]|nr:hypothetical protein [Bacteroidales bacterium]
MERQLLYLKHNFRRAWKTIELVNGIAFSVLYSSRMRRVLPRVFNETGIPGYTFRGLKRNDLI